MSVHQAKSPQTLREGPDNNVHTAKVYIDSTASDGCQQKVFDNQTWRMTRSNQPCDTMAQDSTGAPVPSGTMHRLDAISKSFQGK
jgi:hypothetical protein